MEVTEQQFTDNLNSMPEAEQESVNTLLDQTDIEALQNFSKALGVTLIFSDEGEPTEVVEEGITEEPTEVVEEGITEEPTEVVEEGVTEEPSIPSSLDNEMQELALGNKVEVTGQINDPKSPKSPVADETKMTVEDKAFVINAKAVDKFGKAKLENDIIKPAISSLTKKGIKVVLKDLTRPSKQAKPKNEKDEVEILASRGEMYIPPKLAKEIGFDRLKTINDSGKADTEKLLAKKATSKAATRT